MGKIDLHFHDTKTKHDSSARNISNSDILNIIDEFKISILGIVNHIFFNYEKAKKLIEMTNSNSDLSLAFGIELNICNDKENNDYWQLILLAGKEEAEKLNNFYLKIKDNNTIDEEILIEQIKEAKFDLNNILIYPHFDKGDNKRNAPWRKNGFNKDMFENFSNKFKDILIINEVNSLSKIYRGLNNGIKVLIGSDAQDLNDFKENKAEKLLDIFIKFSSFKKFILFLKKDTNTVNEILLNRNKKTTISNFLPLELLSKEKEGINNFNYRKGINLIFGKRGSGKTVLLKSLQKHFNGQEIEYYSGIDDSKVKFDSFIQELIDEKKEVEKNNFSTNLKNIFSKNTKSKPEFKNIFNNVFSYYRHLEENMTNFSELTEFSRNSFEVEKFENQNIFFEMIKKTKTEIVESVEKNNEKHFDNLKKIYLDTEILDEKKNIKKSYLKMSKEVFNFKLKQEIIKTFSNKIKNNIFFELNGINKKEGGADLPNLNFKNFFIEEMGRFIQKIEVQNKINSLKSEIIFENCYSFGKLKFNIVFTKKIIKKEEAGRNDFFVKKITNISDREKFYEFLNTNSFKNFLSFRETFDSFEKEEIDLFSIIGYDVLTNVENKSKNLSSGQKVEVVFDKVLESPKSILILDEIDYALDTTYINSILIEKINKIELSKTIFLATHSANLAINSVPINWIYREEDGDLKYKTFIGDIYSNELINIENNDEKLSWDKTAIDIFEGGKEAMKKRGMIYEK